MTTRRGVGGAAHQIASGGAGSSPVVASFKTTNVKLLREMLSSRDRQLQEYDNLSPGNRWYFRKHYPNFAKLDDERRVIRHMIKDLAIPKKLGETE